MKRVLLLVAAVLHELQTMGRGPLVFRGGVTRDARLAGFAASGALQVNDDTTFCGFLCHGVLPLLRTFEGISPRGQHRYGAQVLLSTLH